MQKVVTLTMNPALDVATSINSVAPEIKLRCAAPRFHPGGGGINVSRAIRFLGGASCAVYASGGHTGSMLAQLLQAEAIEQYPVPIAGITRESMIVYEESTSLQYRFTMPGPELAAEEWSACLETIFELRSLPTWSPAAACQMAYPSSFTVKSRAMPVSTAFELSWIRPATRCTARWAKAFS